MVQFDGERAATEEKQRPDCASLDVGALSRLRPGISEVDVGEVLGTLGTPPVPTDEGYCFGLAAVG